MNNYLPNGSVLPFGLMGTNEASGIAAFNKTYKNTSMRLGIVVKSYAISDPVNQSKLCPEYDVSVFEQQEDRGSSIITYKNCLSSEGMGSIADFFERTLRVKQNPTSSSSSIDTKGQNGAVVLILCLDGMSEKAIIVGAVTHPDRKSTLQGKVAHLEGEFNGVNIKVNDDGSAAFTFKGPTKNDGKPVDSSKTPTEATVEKDGSFQIKHSTVTVRLDKSGVVTVKASGDINVTTDGNANIKSSAKTNINCSEANITASGKVSVKGSEIDLNGAASGITTMNSHQGVIDFITGVPVNPSTTTKSDI